MGGFDVVESVFYCFHHPNNLSRFIQPFVHSAFNFFISFAISRQKESLLWWVELIVGIILAIGMHALHNYAAVWSIMPIFIIVHAILPWFILIFLLFKDETYPLKFGGLFIKETHGQMDTV